MDFFSRKQAELRTELAKEKRNVNKLRNQLRKEEIKNSKMETILNNNKGYNEIRVDCSKLEKIKKYNSRALICCSILLFILIIFIYIVICINFFIPSKYKNNITLGIILVTGVIIGAIIIFKYKQFAHNLSKQLLNLNDDFRKKSRKKNYTKDVIAIVHDLYLVIYQLIVYGVFIEMFSAIYWLTGNKQFVVIISSIVNTVGFLEIINTSFGSFTKVFNLAAEYFGPDSLKTLNFI
ncbi:hypothetical protein F5ESL0233_08030 [Lactobacillus sp. ESL0233]|uniref:hypothetical protein n=1 Tax=Lactobacillus sp. ESL0233 TaxID=2069354 RepID=UPI000EFAEE75|nr:hypothetical protein [Lactobacillus sp. ESL0233]RMC39061.1 hypothetical protein F5ESL0233_08030 [Lactobacillus sp. ESL0233]